MAEQQEAVRKAGWASLFFCNHDQPRVVSRWGNDSDRDSRELSAKAFGMVLHMHRGTPYIYEGEELGMTNAHFTKLEQYRDLEALNGYRQRVEEAKCQSSESMMAALALIGRDNARTPMQWDASKYAGFTAPDAPVSHGSASTRIMWRSTRPRNSTIRIPCTRSTRSSSPCATTAPPSRLANGICSPPTAIRCMPSPAPMATTRFLSWST